ncbi:hypothetical protein [Haloarcula sediminis]|uniref:hypothetical protein n=1 Tax=Haloarcula sediminis TaxID=3111777 RepID=UPI002D76EE50|nr:hypothetical protein [Haloarcula sp. CK38]
MPPKTTARNVDSAGRVSLSGSALAKLSGERADDIDVDVAGTKEAGHGITDSKAADRFRIVTPR